ncbi:MAG: Protein-L-isoaspartate O-methyltransferase [Pseudomonadota bacterium]|jgi:protein-L-isoaspartate(D-aspartate) O-methyltransferase
MNTTAAMNQARFNMIEQQIRPWDVLDAQVLELLERVRREDFVPSAHRALAYADMELPLGGGSPEVMLAPKVQAKLVQDLQIQTTDRVLEIGTGSGYTAALLAQLAQEVISLEISPALAHQAAERLQAAGITNAQVLAVDACANGFAACKTEAPFDVIVLSGSVAAVPAELTALLADGGRLFAIVGQAPMMRATIVTRRGNGFHTSQPWDTVAPRLQHFAEPSRFAF